MGRAYYYFEASLPMVHFDSKPPMSVESFLEDCQRLLDETDYQKVYALLGEEPADQVQGNSR